MSINRGKQQYFDELSNKVCFINNINNILLYLSDFLLSNRLTRRKCLDTTFAHIQFMHSLGNVCLLALNWLFSVKRNLDVLWLKTVYFILYVCLYVFKRKFTIIWCALYPDCCLLNRLRWPTSDNHGDNDNFWFICSHVTDRATQK